MLGTGMAVAILIGATVARGVLLPTALALLGERAWTPPGRRGWSVDRREPRTHAVDRHVYDPSTARA